MSITQESAVDTRPGWLLRRALQAQAEEERSRREAVATARLANDDRQREWLQTAARRILGVTLDVEELGTDPEGRPHAIIGGEEFRATAPTATGPGLILIVRCRDCWRVDREFVVPSLPQLADVLCDGCADPMRCSACEAGWRAMDRKAEAA